MRLGSYGFVTDQMLMTGTMRKGFEDDGTPNNQRFLQYDFKVREIQPNESVFSLPITHGDHEEW